LEKRDNEHALLSRVEGVIARNTQGSAVEVSKIGRSKAQQGTTDKSNETKAMKSSVGGGSGAHQAYSCWAYIQRGMRYGAGPPFQAPHLPNWKAE